MKLVKIDMTAEKFLTDGLPVSQPLAQETDLADVISIVKSKKRDFPADLAVK
jgi:hypothetical protein